MGEFDSINVNPIKVLYKALEAKESYFIEVRNKREDNNSEDNSYEIVCACGIPYLLDTLDGAKVELRDYLSTRLDLEGKIKKIETFDIEIPEDNAQNS